MKSETFFKQNGQKIDLSSDFVLILTSRSNCLTLNRICQFVPKDSLEYTSEMVFENPVQAFGHQNYLF